MSEFIKCIECNGTGISPYPKPTMSLHWEYCAKCRGLGELTWLENIFGKDLLSMDEIHLRQNNRDIYFNK